MPYFQIGHDCQMQNSSIPTIIKLAIPLILANSIVPILGLINIMVVGHLANATALAAIALGATLFDFLFKVFNFLRISTTGLVAQTLQNDKQVRLIIMRALAIALGLGVLLIALQFPISQLIKSIIHTSPAVMRQVEVFFKANIWSAPAELIIYVITGWLVASKQTRKAFYLVLVLVLCAAPLAYILVDGLHLKAQGIALANVTATFVVAVLGLYWLQKRYHFCQQKINVQNLFCWQELKPMLALKGNVFIRTLALLCVYTFFMLQSARFGELLLAANAILINLLMFASYALDGLANVTESYVGVAIGEKGATKVILRNTLVSSVVVALFLSLVYFLFGHSIVQLLTSLEPVRLMAIHYLPWAYVFPILAVWSFWLDGVFVGATKGKAMRNTMLIATLCFFIAWFCSHAWQNNGLWFSFMCFVVVRALGQLWLLRQKTFFRAKYY